MNDASAPRCYACGEELAVSRAPFDIGDQLSRGFELFKAEMGQCIGATLIYIGLPIAINFVLGVVVGGAGIAIVGAGGDPFLSQAMQQLVQIPGFFVQVFFDAGYAIFLLNLIRGRPASVGDVFSGGRVFLSLALNRFVLYLIIGLPAILPFGLIIAGAIAEEQRNGGGEPLLIAGFATALPVVIWAAVAKVVVWPYIWVVVDRKPAGLDALRASMHLTKGHRWQIVLMGMLWWLLATAGALACCVGVLFTMPIATLMVAIGYDRLLRAKGLGV